MAAGRAGLLAALHLLLGLLGLGGGLALRADLRWGWLQAPLALWFILVLLLDVRCPLTAAERRLRPGAEGTGLEAGFLAHHLLPRLGPRWTRRRVEVAAGLLFLGMNTALYVWAFTGP